MDAYRTAGIYLVSLGGFQFNTWSISISPPVITRITCLDVMFPIFPTPNHMTHGLSPDQQKVSEFEQAETLAAEADSTLG